MAYKFQLGAFTASGSIKAEEGFDANTQPLDNVSNLSNNGNDVEYNDAILMSGSNKIKLGHADASLGGDGNGSMQIEAPAGQSVAFVNGADTPLSIGADLTVDAPLSSSTYISASNIVLQDASTLADEGLTNANGKLALSIASLAGAAELSASAQIDATDEFAISDGGITKKVDFQYVRDAVYSAVSGDATIAAGGALTIAAGAVENSMLDNSSINLAAGAGLASIGNISLGGTGSIAVDGVLEDLDALGAPTADGEFIVATGAGAFAYESGATARASMGVSIGSDVQAWDAQLDDIAALTPTDSNIIVGDGTNWVAESGNTARTSLGLGTGDSPTFTNLTVSGDLLVQGSTVTLDVASVGITGSFVFEGATADGFETTLAVVDPTADRTINLVDQDGFVPVLADTMLASDANVQITAKPAELNLLDAGAGSSVTLAAGDGLIIFDVDDSNSGKKVLMSDVATYVGNNLAETVQTLTATGTISLASGAQVLANSASPITLTLPAPGDLEGKMLKIKRIGGGLVNVSANGSENIDGQAADIVLESTYAAVTIISDGSNYFIV